MKILWGDKDGGSESRVWCWGFESKMFGSALLLKFARGSREAFHTHAFNSISWVLRGALVENLMTEFRDFHEVLFHRASFCPVFTYRDTFHQVSGLRDRNWAITFRGPWVDVWREFLPGVNRFIRLTHGRKEIA